MRNLYVLGVFVALCVFANSCIKDNESDKEKVVEMTIYPETGYGAGVLSDVITQPLVFSDSHDHTKRLMVDIIFEGFELDYERGYQYTLKVKKVWMRQPPQDVSSVKYVFLELLSTQKAITEDSQTDAELQVSAHTVKFMPKYPIEYENVDGSPVPKVYDALYAKETGSGQWVALKEIEGFDFDEGFEYVLSVKKITQANPYLVRYVLTGVVSKQAKA